MFPYTGIRHLHSYPPICSILSPIVGELLAKANTQGFIFIQLHKALHSKYPSLSHIISVFFSSGFFTLAKKHVIIFPKVRIHIY